jgi:cyclic pyranopterin phosphate synthase
LDGCSHFDDSGHARMVNVGNKPVTPRFAKASAVVRVHPDTLQRIRSGENQKGDVLAVARLAGITAAKRTDELIPLCHTLGLDAVEVSFSFPDDSCITIETRAHVTGRTGVEMEALVAASVTALTIYDMCKSLDRAMTIERIRLEEKSGGRSGHFVRGPEGTQNA